MESFEELRAQVPSGVDAFRRRYSHPFLVRRARSLFQGLTSGSRDDSLDFHTTTVKRDGDGLMPWEWLFVPVKKKPENPFPEHITLGRATNRDVVLRYPFVSKLHARFLLESGKVWAIEDCESANGVLRNGGRLKANSPVKIVYGDRLTFGSLVLEYVDAESVFDLVRSRRPSLPGPAP